MTGRARIFHNIRHTGNHQNSDLNSKMTTIQLPSSMLIQNACPSNRITVAPQIACGPTRLCFSLARRSRPSLKQHVSVTLPLRCSPMHPLSSQSVNKSSRNKPSKALEQQRTFVEQSPQSHGSAASSHAATSHCIIVHLCILSMDAFICLIPSALLAIPRNTERPKKALWFELFS